MIDTIKLTQADSGRAFEWAVAYSISQKTGALIIPSTFAIGAKIAYGKMAGKAKELFAKAADVAITHILDKESAIVESNEKKIY